MPSRHKTNKPNRLDKVYVKSRKADNKQPNGYVLKIDWESRVVIVKFLSDPWHQSELDEIDLDDFWGHFSDDFGGTWYL